MGICLSETRRLILGCREGKDQGTGKKKRKVASRKSLLRVASIPKLETNDGSFSLISTGSTSEGFCLLGMRDRSQVDSLFNSPLHLLTAITELQIVDKLLGCVFFLEHPVFLTSGTAGLIKMLGLYLRNSCERYWLVL